MAHLIIPIFIVSTIETIYQRARTPLIYIPRQSGRTGKKKSNDELGTNVPRGTARIASLVCTEKYAEENTRSAVRACIRGRSRMSRGCVPARRSSKTYTIWDDFDPICHSPTTEHAKPFSRRLSRAAVFHFLVRETATNAFDTVNITFRKNPALFIKRRAPDP